MELDKLKKINDLANELKKHNFAKTTEEAAKQAEDFFAKKQEPAEEPKTMKIEQANDALAIERFELIMQMQTKKFREELDLQKATISLLNKKIEELRVEIEKLKGKALSSPIQFEKKEPEVQASLAKPKKEEKKEHPRSGDYSSEDVDINKMFYFGNKQQ